MMAAVMNRLLRPFGLKLGPLQAGAVYFPLHFLAVGIGLTLLIAPQGVGVFWPATGSLFAFLLLYPARYWLALFVTPTWPSCWRTRCSRRRFPSPVPACCSR